jgi:hypothetical protein
MAAFRFVRRDGPRLFLDSRDLINLLEKSHPVSPAVLTKELEKRNGRIVLTYTNVAELVPQTESKVPDTRRVQHLMRQLEKIPHVYFRVSDLPRRELRAAIEAFETGRPIASVHPYVEHFWETFWPLPLPQASAVERPERLALLCRLSLADHVEGLLSNRECLRFDSSDGDALTESVEDDRDRLKTMRGSKKSFMAGIKQQFVKHGWSDPVGGVDEFCAFVHDTPAAAPAWRLAHDVYEEYRCNLTTKPVKNDIADFTHLHALPYATHVTLDNAWRKRCELARDRRAKQGVHFAGYNHLYQDLDAILRAF